MERYGEWMLWVLDEDTIKYKDRVMECLSARREGEL